VGAPFGLAKTVYF